MVHEFIREFHQTAQVQECRHSVDVLPHKTTSTWLVGLRSAKSDSSSSSSYDRVDAISATFHGRADFFIVCDKAAMPLSLVEQGFVMYVGLGLLCFDLDSFSRLGGP